MNQETSKKGKWIPIVIGILVVSLAVGAYLILFRDNKKEDPLYPSQNSGTVDSPSDKGEATELTPPQTEISDLENPTVDTFSDSQKENMQTSLIPLPETEPETEAPTVPTPTRPPEDGLTVTFLGPDESLLYVDVVSPGESAQPPPNPTLPTGYVFSYWDKDFSHVTEDLTVHAVCEQIPADCNVFAAQGHYVQKGETASVSLRLCGKVCLCICNLKISYDPKVLEFVEFRGMDGGADGNCLPQKGEIYLNYASIENTEGEVDLTELVFRAVGTPGQHQISLEVLEADAYDQAHDFVAQNCAVIPATVTIAQGG